MTNDELRALADALEPMARAPRFEDFDVPGFCEWVRACADAQPVAWSDGLGSFIAADERVGDDPDILAYRVPLYTHPAPAVPQAEPDDDDALVLGEPDMLTPEDVRRLVPQAEPKREPLSDAIVTVVYELAALIPKPDQPTVDDWPCDNPADRQALQIAYTTARDARDGIGGSDD